jgi:hypothetical protein
VSELADYLDAPSAPPADAVLEALRAPIDPADALGVDELDRLLDPAPLAAETGWCWTPDHVGYVAVRTEMPGTTAEMWDWWFDWHQRDPLRYRVWYPEAHFGTTFREPRRRGAKPFWGAVHFPDEDIGTGRSVLRISFRAPSEFGFSTDALDDPRVGTIVGGFTGEVRRRARAGRIAHVFLNADDGLVLRSRFWVGSDLRPDLPGALGDAAGAVINRAPVRRLLLPRELPRALGDHCAREYARMAALLPELYGRYA